MRVDRFNFELPQDRIALRDVKTGFASDTTKSSTETFACASLYARARLPT